MILLGALSRRPRRTPIETKTIRINHDITSPQLRVLDASGTPLGIMALEAALGLANESNMDLLEIQPNAQPPLAQIIDYGKFKYRQQKAEAEARQKQARVSTKELVFRPTTQDADYRVKLSHLRELLGEGCRIKVTIRFKGREMSHPELGMALASRLEVDLDGVASFDARPRMEGRQIVMWCSASRTSKPRSPPLPAPA
jgi:translation initiation factor IF-3